MAFITKWRVLSVCLNSLNLKNCFFSLHPFVSLSRADFNGNDPKKVFEKSIRGNIKLFWTRRFLLFKHFYHHPSEWEEKTVLRRMINAIKPKIMLRTLTLFLSLCSIGELKFKAKSKKVCHSLIIFLHARNSIQLRIVKN
jgi:hypothetical protein